MGKISKNELSPNLQNEINKINILSGNDVEEKANKADLTSLEGVVNTHLGEDVYDAGGVHGMIYEQGEFEPVFHGADNAGEMNVVRATYTRINKRCFIDMYINLTAAPTGSSALTIRGFPFPPLVNQSNLVYASVLNAPLRSGATYLRGNLSFTGTFWITFPCMNVDGTSSNIRFNDTNENTVIMAKFSYLIDD